MTILEALKGMVARRASDLHITAGNPPAFRIDGQLHVADEEGPTDGKALLRELECLLDASQAEVFRRERELDFVIDIPGAGRFRGNAAIERGNTSLAFRRVVDLALDLEALGLPAICKDLAMRPRGLVIVTGSAGSGKSTTLAAMIEHINTGASRRVITLEDPIEYVFSNKRSVLTQRQIGEDTLSYGAALKHILRQNPDVIMVGEMRDPETVAAVLTASETGHLVLTTAHAPSAPQTVDRMIDMFPPNQQAQVRTQLAAVLEGVLYQRLLPRADGSGRICAAEVMLGTYAVRSLIREGKTHQLSSAIELGSGQGMQTLDQALAVLRSKSLISQDAARAYLQKPLAVRSVET